MSSGRYLKPDVLSVELTREYTAAARSGGKKCGVSGTVRVGSPSTAPLRSDGNCFSGFLLVISGFDAFPLMILYSVYRRIAFVHHYIGSLFSSTQPHVCCLARGEQITKMCLIKRGH